MLPKRHFVCIWLILLSLGLSNLAKAQEVAPTPQLFTEDKGFSAYLLIQPAWKRLSVFDTRLVMAGFPPTNTFGVSWGVGGYYQFRTGTAVGIEYGFLSSGTELNNNSTLVQPSLYVFNVKQFFLNVHDARLFVNASYASVEEQFTLTPATSAQPSPAQIFSTNNAICLERLTGVAGVGLGWAFEGGTDEKHRLTDRLEVELGYRFTTESPIYVVEGTEVSRFPGDDFRQFYISMRVGLFVKGKAK